MNELKIFLILLKIVSATAITLFVSYFVYNTYKIKKGAKVCKKPVYVDTLKISYIPGTGGYITSKNLSFTNDTLEEARKSQKRLQEIGEKIYERFNSITDKELINIENILIIPKEKFIAAELDSHIKYK